MKRQYGFSLVELMIAMTLGLLLSAAAISAFLGVKKVQSTTAGVASLADSGRFALDHMGQAVRSAGFLACSTSSSARSDLNTAWGTLLTDVGEPLGGYEFTQTGNGSTYTLSPPYGAAGSASSWSTSPALNSVLEPAIFNAVVSGAGAGRVLPGSDILAVHESPVGFAPLYLTGAAAVNTASLVTTFGITPGNTAPLFTQGSLPVVVLSNCQSAEVFAVSAYQKTSPTLTISTSNTQQRLVTAYGAGSHVSLLSTRVYYVGLGSDGEGALYVLDTNGSTAFSAPVELVPDVENMQVLYGVDTTGTQAVGKYVGADQVASTGVSGDFNSVIDVKIALLIAGSPGSTVRPPTAPSFSLLGTTVRAPIDTRLRKVFTTTIALRNTAG